MRNYPQKSSGFSGAQIDRMGNLPELIACSPRGQRELLHETCGSDHMSDFPVDITFRDHRMIRRVIKLGGPIYTTRRPVRMRLYSAFVIIQSHDNGHQLIVQESKARSRHELRVELQSVISPPLTFFAIRSHANSVLRLLQSFGEKNAFWGWGMCGEWAAPRTG
jgi:hypothetical protein